MLINNTNWHNMNSGHNNSSTNITHAFVEINTNWNIILNWLMLLSIFIPGWDQYWHNMNSGHNNSSTNITHAFVEFNTNWNIILNWLMLLSIFIPGWDQYKYSSKVFDQYYEY